MGRILCAWSPTWAIDNWRRRNPPPTPPEGEAPPPPGPFALIEAVRGARRLAAVSREAEALGLHAGQKATDAMALVPGLITADAEPEADAAALEHLVDWCVRFSPAVAADAPDGLFLDITGVDHLFGGEAAMLADLRARLAGNGLRFRCAIADTPGAAWALVHFGCDGDIAPPGGQAPMLAPLPPAALRLPPEPAAQIARLGFRRLGQLMDIPRGPLARRFGQGTLDRLDQALGRGREALAFRRPPTPWIAHLALAEPVSGPEDMARITTDVTAKLCARLEAETRGARRFEIAFHRVDGRAPGLAVGLAMAGRDPARIARLFTPRLETIDPGFGVEGVTLAAYEVEAKAGRQAGLDARAAEAEALTALIDRLANRLGQERVWKAQALESHVPERAVGRAAPLAAAAPGWDPEAPRPLRLFRRPEPVDLVTALLPDEPPIQFRWRGRLHRVRHAEGPERIGEEWWGREITQVRTTSVRDYYRVEDEAGARFWLFRAGLYTAEAPPQWWLHGVFG